MKEVVSPGIGLVLLLPSQENIQAHFFQEGWIRTREEGTVEEQTVRHEGSA
jgi:hypothetical protein